ncbi:MAG: hypothetical protein RMM29_04920 [Planctomycetota bacterium]|nr:hypothetical protein [Planctomycetota bacterium]MDW8372977.1 hypothetical protein [Planctomycetota bacterium]
MAASNDVAASRVHSPSPSAIVQPVLDDPPVLAVAPGIAISWANPPRVFLTGWIAVDRGPIDHGLETLVSLAGGRLHESLVALDSSDAIAVKAACLAAFGYDDGEGSGETDDVPPRGWPMSVRIRWRDDEGRHWIVPASCLMRDRFTDRPLPPLPFVWTGSYMMWQRLPDGAGGFAVRPVYALAIGRVVVAAVNCQDALLASPLPHPLHPWQWEVNTALCPPQAQPVAVEIAPVALPLNWQATIDGELLDERGMTLEDEAVLSLLGDAFLGDAASERWHAIAIAVPPRSPRSIDARLQRRLCALAARAGVTCFPVFVPQREADYRVQP